MKMNETENGWGRGGGGVVGGINRSNGLCEELLLSLGGPTAAAIIWTSWPPPSGSAAQQHSTNTHPRCAAAVPSLGRLAAPNRPPHECNMSLRNARPVPRRLAS
jgi:hypothetical protein